MAWELGHFIFAEDFYCVGFVILAVEGFYYDTEDSFAEFLLDFVAVGESVAYDRYIVASLISY